MTHRLTQLIEQVNEVKKNILIEISEPIQQLVNMINNDELEFITLTFYKDQNFHKPSNLISIKTSNPSTVLGTSADNIEELFGDASNNYNKDILQKIFTINQHLVAINQFLKESIPKDDKTYFYSKSRHNLTENWNAEKAQQWPMIPQWLEPLVNLEKSSLNNN